MKDEERKLFEDVLRSVLLVVFVYDPERRIKADDMVVSLWFLRHCTQEL